MKRVPGIKSARPTKKCETEPHEKAMRSQGRRVAEIAMREKDGRPGSFRERE